MGADQTPDPTAWSDDQLDNLLDALAQRAAERDDLELPSTGPRRRTVLATLLGAGGLGIGATQLGAAASWGSASGTVGTQSSPIDQANVRDLDAKVIETEQLSGHYYAAAFPGSSADARLTNAISAAPTESVIYLETDATYSQDRTISGGYDFFGSRDGTAISGVWTFDNNQPTVAGVSLQGTGTSGFTLDTGNCTLTRIRIGGELITDNTGNNLIFGVDGGAVGNSVIDLNGSGSVVDAARNVIINGNGNNTIGTTN